MFKQPFIRDMGELFRLHDLYGNEQAFNQLPINYQQELRKMAKLPFVFDANQVPPEQSASKLPVSPPEGWPAWIVANEFKAAKDATPQNPKSMLVFTLEIIDGPAKGARGFDRLNLQHPNQTVVDIAFQRLGSYCRATGVFRTDELDHLHHKPFRIVVEQQEDARYTQIVRIKDINGNELTGQTQQPATAPPQAPPAQPPVYQQPALAPQPQWGAPPPAQPPAYQPPQPPAQVEQPGQPQQPPAWTPPGNVPPVAPWQK